MSLATKIGALLTALVYECSPSIIDRINNESQKTNTVLVGEHHYETEDDYIFREQILPILADNGYSHLALEIDLSLQPLADNLPDSLPEISEAIKDCSNYRQIVNTILRAHDLGLQVHFVDDFELGYKGAKNLSERNRKIFENIRLEILNENPDAKVVTFLGASHIPKEPFFRPDAGTVFPLGYWLTQERRQEPYSIVILPYHKLDQYKRFEAKGQTLDIICFDEEGMSLERLK